MANIVYRQMPTPRELPQQIPVPGQKLGCKSLRVGAYFWCKFSGMRGEGVVMAKIVSCISTTPYLFFISPHLFSSLFQQFLAITKSRTSQTKIHAPVPSQPFHNHLFTRNYSTISTSISKLPPLNSKQHPRIRHHECPTN